MYEHTHTHIYMQAKIDEELRTTGSRTHYCGDCGNPRLEDNSYCPDCRISNPVEIQVNNSTKIKWFSSSTASRKKHEAKKRTQRDLNIDMSVECDSVDDAWDALYFGDHQTVAAFTRSVSKEELNGVRELGSAGKTLLEVAVAKGHIKCVRVLVGAGAAMQVDVDDFFLNIAEVRGECECE
jgi:hypothetical protein